MKKVELLAPAGNKESFYAAVYAGADAVYLGGKLFGARAYADNFEVEDICECIRYAHLFNKKVYMTTNTLMKQRETDRLVDFLKPMYEAGLDGCIIQDIGALYLLRENFPGMELHASTQMTLANEYGPEYLKKFGVCRVVPARELSLREIKKIKENTGLSLECFIHGAMCYCYSGQCLFSSSLGERSGNRGRCAQPCRLFYSVSAKEGNTDPLYPLSLKDMCTIEYLPALIKSGIDSFKIEGRMKRPEYVAGVTSIYRKYIDRIYENMPEKDIISIEKKDLETLSSLYIRSEKQNGYYFKRNGRDMVTLFSPAYTQTPEDLLKRIGDEYLGKKLRLKISASCLFSPGKKAYISLKYGDITAEVYGNEVEVSQNKPVSYDNVKKQLSKMGETFFELKDLDINISENAFYPLGAINALRREAVKLLEEKIIAANGFKVSRDFTKTSIGKLEGAEKISQIIKGLSVLVSSYEQFKAVSEFIGSGQLKIIYIESHIYEKFTYDEFSNIKKKDPGLSMILALPYVLRDSSEKRLSDILESLCFKDLFDGCLVRSLDELGFLERCFSDKKLTLIGDAGLYTWNRESFEAFNDDIDIQTLPFELKREEYRYLEHGAVPLEKIVYGRVPMMITANCVIKTSFGCRNGKDEGFAYLKDRINTGFPVKVNCNDCSNIIYNSVPLSLHDSYRFLKDEYLCRLEFTTENSEEVKTVLRFFYEGYINTKKAPFEYTTGHEKKGVE
ncbi:MAG: U32 family peptidase [Acetatifactor sp.]|nr:U32 family peptidase [Acetatifactor sp.]